MVAAVEAGDPAAAAVTLRTLQRLADALSVAPLRLLADPDQDPAGTTAGAAPDGPVGAEHPDRPDVTADAVTLGALLFDRPRNNPVGDVAAALDWPVDRVQTGLRESLEPRLADAGARLHRDNNRYRVVPPDDAAATEAAARLDRGRVLRYGFTKDQTRMLARSFDNGVLARKMPPEQLRVLGRLLHVGYLVEATADDRYRPGPTVVDAITPGAAGHRPQATAVPSGTRLS